MSTCYKDSFKNLESEKLPKTRKLKFVANLNDAFRLINVVDAETGELIEGVTRVEIDTAINRIGTATITIEILPSDLNFGGNARIISGNS